MKILCTNWLWVRVQDVAERGWSGEPKVKQNSSCVLNFSDPVANNNKCTKNANQRTDWRTNERPQTFSIASLQLHISICGQVAWIYKLTVFGEPVALNQN